MHLTCPLNQEDWLSRDAHSEQGRFSGDRWQPELVFLPAADRYESETLCHLQTGSLGS